MKGGCDVRLVHRVSQCFQALLTLTRSHIVHPLSNLQRMGTRLGYSGLMGYGTQIPAWDTENLCI